MPPIVQIDYMDSPDGDFLSMHGVCQTGYGFSEGGRSSRLAPDRLACRIACLTASIASGRGKLLRQAKATRRVGTGCLKGRNASMRFSSRVGTQAVLGRMVMPTPEATM